MTEITWFIKHKRHLSFIMIILFIISILNSNLLSISIHAAYTHHYYYEDYMLYFFAFFGICSFIVLKNEFHCNNKIKKYKNTNYFLFYRVIPFLKTSRVKKVA